jgi:hypothetical protein
VILHWAWSWLSFQRGARLITGSVGTLPPIRAITPRGEPAMPPAAHIVELQRDDRVA